MTKDYAKKTTVKRKPSATPKAQGKKSNGSIIYLVVGLALGLFISFLVYLNQQPEKNSKKLAHPYTNAEQNKKGKTELAKKQQASKKKAPSKQETAQNKQVPQVPEYEFYTMLPDVEVEVTVPPKTVKEPVSKPSTNKKKTDTNKTISEKKSAVSSSSKDLYQLQVGAFQSKEKAEAMKAQIGFMGVQSSISSSWLSNGKKVYKVKIGPSSDEKNLRLIMARLKQMNINPFLQKL